MYVKDRGAAKKLKVGYLKGQILRNDFLESRGVYDRAVVANRCRCC